MNAPLVPVPADSLVAAYAATDFLVLALRPVTLRVDQAVAGLDDWLRAQRCESAVVISARSPFSQVLAEDEEDRRHEELRALVERTGLALSASSRAPARRHVAAAAMHLRSRSGRRPDRGVDATV